MRGTTACSDISAQRIAKAAALRAHHTQHRSTERWIFDKPRVVEILAIETFRQGGGTSVPAVPLDDVFAGIVVD